MEKQKIVIKPQKVEETLEETIETIEEVLDDFEDFEEETLEEVVEEKEKEAVSFLQQFQQYIKSDKFKSEVLKTSKEYDIPPKKLAQGFFEKALGTVGDILGVGISVICNAGHMIVSIAGTIANSIIDLICMIANGVASVVTLNKTCIA